MPIKRAKGQSIHQHMAQHILRNTAVCLVIVFSGLYVGMLGYRLTEGMSWIDAFMNASMILSGMGPASTLHTDGGKFFSGCYALFSGLAFIAVVVIMLSPLIHRFFRKIHFESKNDFDES